MSAEKASPISTFQKRVNAEIQDNLDEDIELELEDDELADLLSETEHFRCTTACRGRSISRSSCACSASSSNSRTG